MKIRSLVTAAAVPALFVCSAAQAQIHSNTGINTPGGGGPQIGVLSGPQPTTETRPAYVNPLKNSVASAVAPTGVGISNRGTLTESNGVVVTPPGGSAPVLGVGQTQRGGIAAPLGLPGL